MTEWNSNPTMKRLGRLYPVSKGNTIEWQDLTEFMQGIIESGEKELFWIVDCAYTLGIARGKQIDRERKKIGKKAQREKQRKKDEFLELYHSASPEVQESVERILQSKDTSPEAVKKILIDCKVDPALIEHWDNIQATA